MKVSWGAYLSNVKELRGRAPWADSRLRYVSDTSPPGRYAQVSWISGVQGKCPTLYRIFVHYQGESVLAQVSTKT
jgi:hypothetical protein